MKTKSANLLLTSLLILSQQANCQTQSPVLLQKNQVTPFEGYLIPPKEMEDIGTMRLNNELYKTELNKQEGQIPLYVAPDSSYLVIGGIGIGILFFFIGYATR
jgi:hypothetical protein